jgi:hypothetical protein
MRARNLIITFCLMLYLTTLGAGLMPGQKPAAKAVLRPFEPAEELLYEAEFSRSLLRKIEIADFRFTANRTAVVHRSKGDDPADSSNDAPYALVFTGDVSSKGFFAKLFNLHFREHVESTVDPVSFTVQNTKKRDEQGKRLRTSEAVYDRASGKVVWTEIDPNNPSRQPRILSSHFTGQVQDVLSVIYYLRTQPLEVGRSFEVSISDSGRVYQVPVRVVEKKRLKTLLGQINCLRVDPGLFGAVGMIGTEGQLSIWLTDDDRRIPVSARIKTEYGTFNIKLKKVIQKPAREFLTKQD